MVKNSLQKKIFVLALFLMFIPLVLFTVFNISTSIRSVEENYRTSQIFSMKKAGSVVENLFQEIDQASLFVLTDWETNLFLYEKAEKENAYESAVQMNRVYNSLSYLKNTADAISSIQIKGVNGRVLSNSSPSQNITDEDWERAVELNGKALWDVEEQVGVKKAEANIYHLRIIKNLNFMNDTVGVVKVYLNRTALDEFFLSERTEHTSYFIMDPDGEVYYESITEDGPLAESVSISYDRLLEANGSTVKVRDKDMELYATPYYLNSCGWIVYSLSQPVAIERQVQNVVFSLVALGICCIMFCIWIALMISRRMCQPLIKITSYMKLLEEGDFSARVEVSGNDEISLVSRQFNKMAERTQSLIEEVYVVNLRKKELELRALQAQVNPHFLYNTLDMIYWTAKMENAPETSDIINSLSQFFRQALSGKDEYTTVENEIEHLRYYVILRRQGSRMFDFDLKVDDNLLKCRVIKFVLQPLVENAIIHGIRNTETGKIEVAVYEESEKIVYTITDNGHGVDEEDIGRLLNTPERNHRGFGIKNINDRIKIVYGEDYGIHFENLSTGGTKVTVIQPREEWEEHGKTDDS